MSDYGYVHDGKVYTPNGTPDISTEKNERRNAELEAAELRAWAEQPDTHLAYYDEKTGRVTTWGGVLIGRITTSHVYRHNFGSRMITMRVIGTNGATYHGRASYDWGSCIRLRKTGEDYIMRRNWRDVPIVRRFTATITFHGDPRGITTTIHGSNPTDAEDNYKREHPDVRSIVVHAEQR
jgi:hypothetical protein